MIYDSLATTTWLGETPPDAFGSPEAWGSYLVSLRSGITEARARAIASYNTLKKVRQVLDLPFSTTTSGEGYADLGAWPADYEQQAVDILAMTKVFVDGANDVLSGKRKLMWDEQIQDFAIEGFSSDPLRLQYGSQGQVVLVNAAGGQVHPGGQVGEVWKAALTVLAPGGLALVSGLALGASIYKGLGAIETVSKQKTARTLAETSGKYADAVKSGKMTPKEAKEQLDKLDQAIASAGEKEDKKKRASDLMDTVTTIAWVSLGLGVLYVVAQVIGKMPSAPALAAAKDNPDYTQSRIFYLPAHMRDVPPLTPSGTDLEIWTWEQEAKGRQGPYTAYYGIAFAGKAGKPLWYHQFANAASRLDMIKRSIASRKSHIEYIDKRLAKRREFRHTLKVGDVLYTSGGYDETHVDFYEVTTVKDKSVTICKIGKSLHHSSGGSADYVVAVPGKCIGKPMTKRVGGDNEVKIDYHWAHPWDGKPKYETALGWGH